MTWWPVKSLAVFVILSQEPEEAGLNRLGEAQVIGCVHPGGPAAARLWLEASGAVGVLLLDLALAFRETQCACAHASPSPCAKRPSTPGWGAAA